MSASQLQNVRFCIATPAPESPVLRGRDEPGHGLFSGRPAGPESLGIRIGGSWSCRCQKFRSCEVVNLLGTAVTGSPRARTAQLALHRPPASGAPSRGSGSPYRATPGVVRAIMVATSAVLMVFSPIVRAAPNRSRIPVCHLLMRPAFGVGAIASSIRSSAISSICRRASASSATPWTHGLPSSGARASFGLENFETPKGTSVFVLTSTPHRRGQVTFFDVVRC
jgi:hypothetical protein